MFTSFQQGKDAVDQWDDTPSYVPGRFHAHALPSSNSLHSPLSSSPSGSNSPSRARSPPPFAAHQQQPTAATRRAQRTTAAVNHPSRLAHSITQNLLPDSEPTKKGRFKSALSSLKSTSSSSTRFNPSPSSGGGRIPSTCRTYLPTDEPFAPRQLVSPIPSFPQHPRLIESPPTLERIEQQEEQEQAEEEEEHDESTWLLLRPNRKKVENSLSSWYKRWGILVLFPSMIVWIWSGLPFPVKDPYKGDWGVGVPWDPPITRTSARMSVSSIIGIEGDMIVQAEEAIGMDDRNQVMDASLGKSDHPVKKNGEKIFELRRRDDAQKSFRLLELVQPDAESMPSPAETMPIVMIEASFLESEVLVSSEGDRRKPKGPGEEGGNGEGEEELPVDANFYFFLFVYYGIYLAVALIFVTKLFDLYRLNWWPSTLGGSLSYLCFWSFALLVGFLLHHWDLDGLGRRSHSNPRRKQPTDQDGYDWERKTVWVLLAFFAMTLPAIACFFKLRSDRRQTYRRSLNIVQKTFLERQLFPRMPRSYRRFLWFLVTLTISLFALIIGQGFATVYLSTLPHSNIDGLVYVWTWIITVQILNATSNYILQQKVRSRALVFVFRYYYFLVYHVFYRSLFARLRSPDQAAYIQLLSSSFVILWYPLSMCRPFHSLLRVVTGLTQDYEDYIEDIGSTFYLRNLSENVTMVAFLGWLTILHYGPNKQVYPYFSFESPTDPYTYKLTAIASLIIWATELGSSFIARQVIWFVYELDVTNLGLDEFREQPELVVACLWTSIHVLMDMLLFLVKLNFR